MAGKIALLSLAPAEMPPRDLFRGELGPELLVLTVSDVRQAEEMVTPGRLETADGDVAGRIGDIVITAPSPSSERYPILRKVFYGAYEVLGKVGTRLVAKRLIHLRRAWPVISDHAEFNYGADRGLVCGGKGSWIYRSDVDDCGLINAEAIEHSHRVVGELESVAKRDWLRLHRGVTLGLTLLAPVLAFLALVAFALAREHSSISAWLLAAEGGLLLAGVSLALVARRRGWALKAAARSGLSVACDFLPAAELLGEHTSPLYPSMSLWRAAQIGSLVEHEPKSAAAKLRAVKEHLGARLQRIGAEIHRHHASERVAGFAAIAAVMAILACILYLTIGDHSQIVEVVAVWLPSVIGALHAFNLRKQLNNRMSAGREFVMELVFVRNRLSSLTPNDEIRDDLRCKLELEATLKVLCRAVATYTQHQLRFAIADDPELPL